MRKFLILSITLLLSAGLWAVDRNQVVEEINNAASAAITEIQNASTQAAAKPIQDQAISDINSVKDDAIREIATAYDEMEISMVKTWVIGQIGRIKDQALDDIQAIMGQETALKEVYGSPCTPKGLMHNGKFLHNGQLFIRKDGKLYNTIGMQIQ